MGGRQAESRTNMCNQLEQEREREREGSWQISKKKLLESIAIWRACNLAEKRPFSAHFRKYTHVAGYSMELIRCIFLLLGGIFPFLYVLPNSSAPTLFFFSSVLQSKWKTRIYWFSQTTNLGGGHHFLEAFLLGWAASTSPNPRNSICTVTKQKTLFAIFLNLREKKKRRKTL